MKKIFISCLLPLTITPFLSSCSHTVNGNQTYKVCAFKDVDDINWKNIDVAPINIYKWKDNSPVFDAYAQMALVQNQEFVIKL